MAMDKSAMADLIITNLKALNSELSETFTKPFWEAICQGIIDHMKSDTDVLPGTFVDGQSQAVTGLGKVE